MVEQFIAGGGIHLVYGRGLDEKAVQSIERLLAVRAYDGEECDPAVTARMAEVEAYIVQRMRTAINTAKVKTEARKSRKRTSERIEEDEEDGEDEEDAVDEDHEEDEEEVS